MVQYRTATVLQVLYFNFFWAGTVLNGSEHGLHTTWATSVDYNGRSLTICRATYTTGRALAPWSDIVAGQAYTCARATVERG